MALHLSVNLNKVALLRNSRGAKNPSPVLAGIACLDAGASGLTLHWREDSRHARRDDVRELRALCLSRGVEMNLEGDDREELLTLAEELGVDQFTLVPVRPGEITSDHGWDLPRENARVAKVTSRMKARGIRTSIFMDADTGSMRAAKDVGADRVELYTEPYAAAFPTEKRAMELGRLKSAAEAAAACGLGVNAGHDLDLHNLPTIAREIPQIVEVSIGHALIADALYLGLAETVRRYVTACAGGDVVAPRTHE